MWKNRHIVKKIKVKKIKKILLTDLFLSRQEVGAYWKFEEGHF